MDEANEPPSVVVPVKETWRAKSRLAIDPRVRCLLARRLALATTQAALSSGAVGSVLVVTKDEVVSDMVRDLGASVVSDAGVFGLNSAADLGRRRALETRPNAAVVILVADLPLLGAGDLDVALAAFRRRDEPMRVADHHCLGTTLLMHGPRALPMIRFGGSSARRHVQLGYQPYDDAPMGLRHDLDTLTDVKLALQLARGPEPLHGSRSTVRLSRASGEALNRGELCLGPAPLLGPGLTT